MLSPKAFSQEYFQQEVNITLKVTLNDSAHTLDAFETIEYINNSTDSLLSIYFHLWPNAYASNKTALAWQIFCENGKTKLFNNPKLSGYIDSLDFYVNNKKVHWNLMPQNSDICQLVLNEPLFPGDTLIITTPFHVKIPDGTTSRLGHIGESYQISQWYPKPAVYDTDGWHPMSYLDQGEFYAEFGTFNVSITLPENYIIGATGNLENPEELQRLEKLSLDTSWVNKTDWDETAFPTSSKNVKTLHYTENNIHDFAWFADKRFLVRKGSVMLPNSGREITTWAMFTHLQADLWINATTYIDSAIWYFSTWNGDYPYRNFTAVQSALSAGDGMEYPGLTVVGFSNDAYRLHEVIAHEICHSWYYSALGSNERRYPFLDEGLTSASETRYMQKMYPNKMLWEISIHNEKLAKFFHIDKMPAQRKAELEWLTIARENLEQPVNLSATDYSSSNYSMLVYDKAAMGFDYLRAYLGDSLFDSSMQSYYETWKFKHPRPKDLHQQFEVTSGKDLSWFFVDYVGTIKRLDYEIVCYRDRKVLVKNKGELAGPLNISGMIADSVCFEKWVDGFEGLKWIEIPEGNYSTLKIDPKHVTPELCRLNNNLRTTGIFPKSDPLKAQLFFTLEDPEIRYLMYLPTVNWTREDGFMLGLAFHNKFFTPKPFEYFILPFITFRKAGLVGYGRISYNISPYEKTIRKATISLETTKFGAPGNQSYSATKAGMQIFLRPKPFKNTLSTNVYGNFIAATDLYAINLEKSATIKSFVQLGGKLENTRIINPYQVVFAAESGHSYLKTSMEVNYKLSYYGEANGLDIRFFAGKMLKSNPDIPFYAFAPGGRSGSEEYLFEGLFPDRFSPFPTTFWSRQISFSEGNIVSPIRKALGYSNWLASLSLTSNLPWFAAKVPVKPFVNILLNDHGLDAANQSLLFFEAGFKVGIWNFFEMYVPLVASENLDLYSVPYKDRVRITLNAKLLTNIKLKRK